MSGRERRSKSRKDHLMQLSVVWLSALMLAASNIFMTFAWYAHLKELSAKPWWIAALISWGIALFEYLLQVPANRIGYTQMSLPQLKILQEAIRSWYSCPLPYST